MRAGVPVGVPFSCHLHKNIGLFLSYLLLRLEVVQGGGKQKPRRRRGGRAACHGGRRGASGRAGHWDARHAPRLSSGREQAAGHPGSGPSSAHAGGRRAPWGGPRRMRTWAAGRRRAYLEIPSSCTELTLQGIPLSKVTGHLLTRPC